MVLTLIILKQRAVDARQVIFTGADKGVEGGKVPGKADARTTRTRRLSLAPSTVLLTGGSVQS